VNHDFQTFNWNGMMASLGNIHGWNERNHEKSNDRDDTILLLGQIYRHCPDLERSTLLWGLADLFTCPASEQACHNSQEICSLEPPSASRNLSQTQRKKKAGQNRDVHLYTSRLNEMAQKEGKTFRRIREEIVSYDPPFFKITVEYGDMTCAGQARTKKEAAHLAAKGICKELDKNLSHL
jgi:hypothetical protein